MNKREIAEIKKINKFSSDGCTIGRMCVCYVDAEKNIILKDRDAFFSLPEDEIFKYWEILRKWLSGKLGKNLLSKEIKREAEELQYSITAIGSVVLQTAVNSLGSMAVAAVSTGSKVSMFFCCPFDALGGTMATYAGQNVGAKKLDRVKEGLKAASLIGIIYSVIAFVILFFGGKYIALLFMDADQTEIIGRVAMFLIGNSMFYIPLTFVNVVRFTIQGMGFSTFAILAGVCEMAARSLVGFCLVPVFGFLPACFASPLAWIFADAFLIPAFFHCMKKLKVLFGEAA